MNWKVMELLDASTFRAPYSPVYLTTLPVSTAPKSPVLLPPSPFPMYGNPFTNSLS
jgi:hypothetical protein